MKENSINAASGMLGLTQHNNSGLNNALLDFARTNISN
jgi:hypothetical protein